MAGWNSGIKLLLAAYKGPEVRITREKNSLSDFVISEKISAHFEPLFVHEKFFDGEAFENPPSGSTKGTNLQHYFNNLIFSPSRTTDVLEAELSLVKDNEDLVLPLKDQFVRWKWFVEGVNELRKLIEDREYRRMQAIWKTSQINFLNPFDFFSLNNAALIKQVPQGSLGSAQTLIFYGPPGTGKTTAAVIVAQDLITGKDLNLDSEALNFREYPTSFMEQCSLNYFGTQFHPSFSYEDFIEGLRPVQVQTDDATEVTYLVIPGVFKVAALLARAYLQPEAFGIDLNVQYVFDKSTKLGNWILGENSLCGMYNLLERKGYLTFNGQKVCLTGESKYENIAGVKNPDRSGIYAVKWFYCGSNESKNFVLFIDELNRGNPAKIFGEALSLVEDTKRLGKREQTSITLPYSRDSLMVTSNLHVICSMNSSDKSLANLDQAFRRRFDFLYFPPAFEIITSESFKKTSKGRFSDDILKALRNHFEVINRALGATGISQENYIGHSYLLKLLRNSFLEMESAKNADQADKVIRNNLSRIWKTDLHSQIRDVVGDHKLEEYCENFSTEANKITSNDVFLISTEDVSKALLKFLGDVQPILGNFPWKKAS